MYIVGERGRKCGIKSTNMRIMTLEGVLNTLRAHRHNKIREFFDSQRSDLRAKAQEFSQLTFEQYYLQADWNIRYYLPNIYFSIPDNLIPPKNKNNIKVSITFILQQAQEANLPLNDRFIDYPPNHEFFNTLAVEIDEDDLEDEEL